MSLAKSNPFATRFVAPGQLQWIAWDESCTIDALRERFLNQLHRRAAIVGPHGSGKSTLLEHLVPTIGNACAKVAAYEQTRVPDVDWQAGDILWLRLRGKLPSTQLVGHALRTVKRPQLIMVIDGYEQLPLAMRLKLLLITRARQQGVLITTHQTSWLKTLVQTRITLKTALAALEALVPIESPNRSSLMEPAIVTALLNKHRGNLREVFMELYDTIG